MPRNTRSMVRTAKQVDHVTTVSHDGTDASNSLAKKHRKVASKPVQDKHTLSDSAWRHQNEGAGASAFDLKGQALLRIRGRSKPGVTMARFCEDDNEVEFEVECGDLYNEFPSEGEISDSDDTSDGEELSQSSQVGFLVHPFIAVSVHIHSLVI